MNKNIFKGSLSVWFTVFTLLLLLGCDHAAVPGSSAITKQTTVESDQPQNSLPKFDTPPAVIMEISASKLPKMLNRVPAGQEARFGFNNPDEFSSASTGIPLEVYHGTVHEGALLINSSKQYRVPVLRDNKPVALLTLSNQNGVWTVVDFGGAGIAKELADKKLTGKKINLLRIRSIKSDFIIIKQDDSIHYLPLQSAKLSGCLPDPETGYFDHKTLEIKVLECFDIVKKKSVR